MEALRYTPVCRDLAVFDAGPHGLRKHRRLATLAPAERDRIAARAHTVITG